MLPSCYSDLVNSIEALSTDDQKDLYDHVLDHVKTIRAESEVCFACIKLVLNVSLTLLG